MNSDSCAALLLDLLARRQAGTEPLVVGITSAVRGEGRTKLAVTLAETLATEMEQPACLVGLDFEHNTLPEQYNLGETTGLAGVLLENGDAAFYRVKPNLLILPATTTSEGHSLRLSATLVEKGLPLAKLSEVGPANTVVLLDLPPLLDSPYGVQLAGLATYLVLVVRSNATSANTIKRGLHRLEEAGYRDRVIASVLTAARQATPRWLTKIVG